jgi:hypothetical protein
MPVCKNIFKPSLKTSSLYHVSKQVETFYLLKYSQLCLYWRDLFSRTHGTIECYHIHFSLIDYFLCSNGARCCQLRNKK